MTAFIIRNNYDTLFLFLVTITAPSLKKNGLTRLLFSGQPPVRPAYRHTSLSFPLAVINTPYRQTGTARAMSHFPVSQPISSILFKNFRPDCKSRRRPYNWHYRIPSWDSKEEITVSNPWRWQCLGYRRKDNIPSDQRAADTCTEYDADLTRNDECTPVCVIVVTVCTSRCAFMVLQAKLAQRPATLQNGWESV